MGLGVMIVGIDSKIKEQIDNMDYREMLYKWRFLPPGDPLFLASSGEYFVKEMLDKKKYVDHVQISKDVGWV